MDSLSGIQSGVPIDDLPCSSQLLLKKWSLFCLLECKRKCDHRFFVEPVLHWKSWYQFGSFSCALNLELVSDPVLQQRIWGFFLGVYIAALSSCFTPELRGNCSCLLFTDPSHGLQQNNERYTSIILERNTVKINWDVFQLLFHSFNI